MAMIRQRGTGNWEARITNKALLAKPWFGTFDDEKKATATCTRFEAMLAKGVVPPEMKDEKEAVVTLAHAIRLRHNSPVESVSIDDQKIEARLIDMIGATTLNDVNYKFVQDFVARLKHQEHKSPGTIRHYTGALGRLLGWLLREGKLPSNPVRELPRSYAQYNPNDTKLAGVKRIDNERDRRLLKGEEEKIRKVIAERKDHVVVELFFTLALESAMRMREMFTLTVDQVDLSKKTVFLDKTKNGDKRQVPTTSVALAALTRYLKGHRDEIAEREGRLFPWWGGDVSKEGLAAATSTVSRLFANIFEAAGCPDLHFHDSRHEATSRLFERTKMNELKIAKITGHRTLRTLARYANLRGSTLAEELW